MLRARANGAALVSSTGCDDAAAVDEMGAAFTKAVAGAAAAAVEATATVPVAGAATSDGFALASLDGVAFGSVSSLLVAFAGTGDGSNVGKAGAWSATKRFESTSLSMLAAFARATGVLG